MGMEAIGANDINSKLFSSVGLSSNNAARTVVGKNEDGGIFTKFLDKDNKTIATKYEDGSNIGFCNESNNAAGANKCVNISANTVKDGMLVDTPDDKARMNNFISSSNMSPAQEGTLISSNTTVKDGMLVGDNIKSLTLSRSNSPFPSDLPPAGSKFDMQF